jgi:hypothetical protein
MSRFGPGSRQSEIELTSKVSRSVDPNYCRKQMLSRAKSTDHHAAPRTAGPQSAQPLPGATGISWGCWCSAQSQPLSFLACRTHVRMRAKPPAQTYRPHGRHIQAPTQMGHRLNSEPRRCRGLHQSPPWQQQTGSAKAGCPCQPQPTNPGREAAEQDNRQQHTHRCRLPPKSFQHHHHHHRATKTTPPFHACTRKCISSECNTGCQQQLIVWSSASMAQDLWSSRCMSQLQPSLRDLRNQTVTSTLQRATCSQPTHTRSFDACPFNRTTQSSRHAVKEQGEALGVQAPMQERKQGFSVNRAGTTCTPAVQAGKACLGVAGSSQALAPLQPATHCTYAPKPAPAGISSRRTAQQQPRLITAAGTQRHQLAQAMYLQSSTSVGAKQRAQSKRVNVNPLTQSHTAMISRICTCLSRRAPDSPECWTAAAGLSQQQSYCRCCHALRAKRAQRAT